jgi:hypothetical protein
LVECFSIPAFGVGHRGVLEFPKRTASVKLTPECAFEPGKFRDPAPLWSPAVGVGHDPDSVPLVKGTDGRSRYAIPFRVVPARGQVAENVSER